MKKGISENEQYKNTYKVQAVKLAKKISQFFFVLLRCIVLKICGHISEFLIFILDEQYRTELGFIQKQKNCLPEQTAFLSSYRERNETI